MSTKDARSQFDQAKAEAFAKTLLTVLNNGALCLMVSVGHRTGLFDVMRGLPASTSDEIAAKAGLQERYVREWLGAMVVSGVVEFDPDSKRFELPLEHAAFATRAVGPDNLALLTQYIGVLANVEDDIVGCFRRGGGVPYEKYRRFHEVMAEDSGNAMIATFEEHILPLIPGLADRLASGIRALDAGCGRGRTLNHMASLFPKSHFIGMDLSKEAIAAAEAEAARKNLQNVEFVAIDLTNFDETAPVEAFDLITTFDAIHDQAQPLRVLKGIHQALKPDGVYLMQDINGSSHLHKDIEHPLGTFLYTISCMHCMSVSLAQGGEGLGAMWGEEKTREYLKHAGFRSIQTNKLEHDPVNNWYVVTK